jgi:hypothetical protein
MKKIFLFLSFLTFVIQHTFSQGDLDEQKKIFYRNEKSLAVMLNSNGFGLNGRYSVRIDAFRKKNFDFEIVSLKHPQEYRSSSSSNTSTRGYIIGKLNNVFVLRPGYGKQKEVFQKFDIGGISVRRFYSFGPSLALLKPIYYEVQDPLTEEIKTQKFNITYVDYILGKASFFKGFDEISVKPGAFFKGGISFEFSKFDQVIHAIEGGVIAEGFISKLPIMATKQNYQFFLTLFVSYRFGKVVDTYHPNNDAESQGGYNY